MISEHGTASSFSRCHASTAAHDVSSYAASPTKLPTKHRLRSSPARQTDVEFGLGLGSGSVWQELYSCCTVIGTAAPGRHVAAAACSPAVLDM